MEESNTEGQTAPQQPHSNEVCSAAGECERCPHRWRVSLETEDEQIRGEFESCQLYERRQRYDCTLFYGESMRCDFLTAVWNRVDAIFVHPFVLLDCIMASHYLSSSPTNDFDAFRCRIIGKDYKKSIGIQTMQIHRIRRTAAHGESLSMQPIPTTFITAKL